MDNARGGSLASIQAERERMLAKLRDTAAAVDERISAGRQKIALQGEAAVAAAATATPPLPSPPPAVSAMPPRAEPEPEPEPEPLASPRSRSARATAAAQLPYSSRQQNAARAVERGSGAHGAPAAAGESTVQPWRETEREFSLLGPSSACALNRLLCPTHSSHSCALLRAMLQCCAAADTRRCLRPASFRAARRERAWQAERASAAERESQLVADLAVQRAAAVEAAARPATTTAATAMSPTPRDRGATASVQTSPRPPEEAESLAQALAEVETLRQQVLDLEGLLAEQRELADARQQVLWETENENSWLSGEVRKLEAGQQAEAGAAEDAAGGWERRLEAQSEQHALELAAKDARIAQLTGDLAEARAAMVVTSVRNDEGQASPLPIALPRVPAPSPAPQPYTDAPSSCADAGAEARSAAVEALETELVAVKQVAVQQTMQAHAARQEVEELQALLTQTTQTALHHAKVMEAESARQIDMLRQQLAAREAEVKH